MAALKVHLYCDRRHLCDIVLPGDTLPQTDEAALRWVGSLLPRGYAGYDQQELLQIILKFRTGHLCEGSLNIQRDLQSASSTDAVRALHEQVTTLRREKAQLARSLDELREDLEKAKLAAEEYSRRWGEAIAAQRRAEEGEREARNQYRAWRTEVLRELKNIEQQVSSLVTSPGETGRKALARVAAAVQELRMRLEGI